MQSYRTVIGMEQRPDRNDPAVGHEQHLL